MSSAGYSNLDSTAAIALVLARSVGRRSNKWPYVKDISELFVNLRQMGFRFRDLGLRRIPDGYYSEDVENFVGQLLSMGYASQRSPITLEEDGRRLCQDILSKETQRNPDEVEKLGRAVEKLLRQAQVTS